MKTFQVKFDNLRSFVSKLKAIKKECGQLPGSNVVFYLNWTENSRELLAGVTARIDKYFPEALYYGNEASGNILGGSLVYGIAVTCYVFENKSTKVKLLWVEKGTEYASLEDLWAYCRKEKGLRAVELIPSMSYIGALQMDNSRPDISDDVLIFGGASVNYDNATFDADIIAKGHALTRDGMAVMLYCGRSFNASAAYILGWKGTGHHMKVTGSHDKVISELDGVPAFSVYEKYLGLQMNDNANLVFPLIVEEDGVEYIRTPQAFLPDKSMKMFANIEEGLTARIAYGDKNTILNSLAAKYPSIEAFAPQAIKAYSCAARRLFWGDDEVWKETLPLQELAPVSGFYTGGEILRFGPKLRVLNSTLVIISLREGGRARTRGTEQIEQRAVDKSLVSRLTYFAERIVEEQEQAHRQLEKALAAVSAEKKRFDVLHEIVHSGQWSFIINDADEVVKANYSANMQEVINNDLKQEPDAWHDLVHPDDLAAVRAAYEAAVADHSGRTPYDVNFRMRDRNGNYNWFWASGRVVRQADGSGEFFGIHININQQMEEEKKRLLAEKAELQLKHEQLRSEVLNFMIDNDDDPIELLKNFAEQLRVLISCDQVIYRDLEETRIMVNSPAIEKTWSVPMEYCQQCEHFDAHHPMYKDGYTEMANCQEGWQGIPVYEKCPIKSSLTRIVYCDGKVAGYLAIHYVQDYHQFTDIERSTIEEFTRILSIALSRFAAREENKELRLTMALKESEKVIKGVAADYSVVYMVNMADDSFRLLRMDEGMLGRDEIFTGFAEAKEYFITTAVYEADRDLIRREMDYAVIREKLAETPSYSVPYRTAANQLLEWFEMRVTRIDDDRIVFGFREKTAEIIAQLFSDKLLYKYDALYLIDLNNNEVRPVRPSRVSQVGAITEKKEYTSLARKFAETVAPEYKQDWLNFSDTGYLKRYMADEDKREYIYELPGLEKTLRRLTIEVLERVGGQAAFLLMAFEGVDDLMAKTILLNRKLAEQKVLLDYFMKSYSSAYTMNLLDDTFEALHIDEEKAYKISGGRTREDMLKFIDEHIHPDDKELMLKNIDKEYVINRLRKENSYSFVIREIFGPEEKLMRCHILCCPDEYHIAVGFMDISEAVREEQAQKKKLEESLAIIRREKSRFEIVKEIINSAEWSMKFSADDELISIDFSSDMERVINHDLARSPFEWKQIIPAEDFPAADASFKAALSDHSDKTPYDANFRMLDRDGRYNWFHVAGRIKRDDDGNRELFGIHININKRMEEEQRLLLAEKAEVELQHEQFRKEALSNFVVNNEDDPVELFKSYAERLRKLIDCDQVIYRGADDTRILVNSPAFAGEWTVPVEYCRQCPHFDMQNPLYKDGYTEMENCREGWQGIPVYEECPVKSAITRIIYCDGEAAGYLSLHYIQDYHRFTDIERSTLEEITRILSISLSRYKARKENKELKLIAEMQEQLKESLAFTDYFLGTYVSAYYVGLDDLTCEIYKRTAELEKEYPVVSNYVASVNEYIGRDVHPEDRENLRKLVSPENIKSVLKASPEIAYNFRDISGGVEKIYQFQAIRGADEAHAAFGFKDITEAVAEEQARRQELAAALESAETANKSKSSFLFNMSHDIRTPMNAITGFTSMAKKYLDDRDRVEDYLNKIDVSGQQLLSLVNQVLEMSRIESGKVEFNNQPVNIKEKYDSLVTILAAQAAVNGLIFNASIKGIRHFTVLADEARMGQITLNITGNALKYTPKGGEIDFSLTEIPCEREGWARYRFTVADTGIGMSEEYLKVLFEPFTREKSSTVSKIQGTGLGMSIVKDLVDLLGGKIEVQSELGKGTRFDITVDFEITAETAGKEETRALPTSFDGKRVLLVEDNELNREIARDILEEFGLLVEEADDGDVALEMMKAIAERGEYDYYDIILMDIQMPRMNGYDATRAIRAYPDPTNSHLPIIAMTANAFEEDRRNAIEAGMDGHLAKPIDIGKLLETLAKFL